MRIAAVTKAIRMAGTGLPASGLVAGDGEDGGFATTDISTSFCICRKRRTQAIALASLYRHRGVVESAKECIAGSEVSQPDEPLQPGRAEELVVVRILETSLAHGARSTFGCSSA